MTTTYPAADAQENLAELWDKALRDREIILHRESGEDLALIAADELSSLLETAHLLRSPANARRLLASLHRAQTQTGSPQTVAGQPLMTTDTTATLAPLEQWIAEAPTDPDEIAEAEADLRQFQQVINQTREAAGAQPIYPSAL